MATDGTMTMIGTAGRMTMATTISNVRGADMSKEVRNIQKTFDEVAPKIFTAQQPGAA